MARRPPPCAISPDQHCTVRPTPHDSVCIFEDNVPSRAVDKLVELLREVGPEVEVTFDPDANITHPCFNCGDETLPHKLAIVGTWSRRVGLRGKEGSPIRRPMCTKCEP